MKGAKQQQQQQQQQKNTSFIIKKNAKIANNNKYIYIITHQYQYRQNYYNQRYIFIEI